MQRRSLIVPTTRRLTRSAPVALALALLGCGKESRFVAIEPNGDADVRVVLTTASTGQRTAQALTRDEPFQLPLKDVFSGDQGSLRVYVYAFTLAALGDEFPALAGLGASEVAARLAPAQGTPEAGAYAPPKPLRVLTAEIAPNGNGDVTYEEVALASVADDPNASLVFRLPAALACPPGEEALRAFNRSDPSRVCLFTRSAGCAWEHTGGDCPNLGDVLERSLAAGASLREVPPSTLVASSGDLSCPAATDEELGESRAWLCPAASGETFVAVQDTPPARDRSPWIARVSDTRDVGGTGAQLARVPRGAIFAGTASNGTIELKRLQMRDSVETDVIRQTIGLNASPITLAASAVGRLRRLSSNDTSDLGASVVVVDGDAGTAVLLGHPGVNSDYNPLTFYHQPVMIPAEVVPRGRVVGEVIAGPTTNVYALVDTGVIVVGVDLERATKLGETPAGAVALARGTHPTFAAVRKGTEERAVVWLDDGTVYTFDVSGALKLSECVVTGDVLGVVDGPRLIRRPAGARFVVEVLDLAQAEANGACGRGVARYLVPASDEAGAGSVTLGPGAFLVSNDREWLLYHYGAWAGVLDLGSGYSTAVALSAEPAAAALFERFDQAALHAAFVTRDRAPVETIALPLLGDLP